MTNNLNHKKIELLAPAGDFSCFKAAINAGADAIYLGGDKFGARAYAHNFSEQEIIDALKIAHLFQRKIYLTVNTLVKEKEISDLIPYLTPLYNAGLDGVIVQDLGVLMLIRDNFPGLELHASTQMTITGVYGAKFLKELGVCRIVPARELSLTEIADIKRETGLAIETFIHGAMCYAYSGQCLFSSILGGRSGNRGRCAGPCRLPYTDVHGHTTYPLSLKDMYTLPMIPKLIEAGIDSFKIEGRMKSPEYVAGVTAMYRKYIDLYLSEPDKPFHILPQDESLLRSLYIRTDICKGYYEQHNSRDMVTLKEAGYSGSENDVLNSIRANYLESSKTLPISGSIRILANETTELTLAYNNIKVIVKGDIAGTAINRPLSEADIHSRISKMGETCFSLTHLEVITDNQSFVPVKSLNELRRQACMELQSAILSHNTPDRESTTFAPLNGKKQPASDVANQLYASVTTLEQLEQVVVCSEITGVYIAADLAIDEKLQKSVFRQMKCAPDKKYYLALPYILRKRSYGFLVKYAQLLNMNIFCGVLIRNMEELQWLLGIDYSGQYISDYTVYLWNKQTSQLLEHYFVRHTLPIELNRKELDQLTRSDNKSAFEMCIYGRLPLMFSANCVRKTLETCTHDAAEPYMLTDRYRNHFPVVQNCRHCYNTLYNTVPLSLHSQIVKLKSEQYGVYRLDFTLEGTGETAAILNYYSNLWRGNDSIPFPYADYTNGHYKRGVE